MIVGTCTVYMSAGWVTSLKEKRTIVKSIIDKIKNKFNVSVAEILRQDSHKSIVIGFACVSNDTGHAHSTINHVIQFIENNTDALIEDFTVEIL